ncbi:hypothetical protein [Streptomyces sp. NPDC047829]|uniref:hypothetical protein n=1 Tax=Streptomyces sp. NPDC047829 TaxID=3154609 RepID=UPI0033ED909D
MTATVRKRAAEQPQPWPDCRRATAPAWSASAPDLYEAIPAQHHHERAVRELREALAA